MMRGFAPFFSEDDFLERLARPGSFLTETQIVGESVRECCIPDRQGYHGLVTIRYCEKFTCFLSVESTHLMDSQAERRRLNSQVSDGLSEIVPGMPVRFPGPGVR